MPSTKRRTFGLFATLLIVIAQSSSAQPATSTAGLQGAKTPNSSPTTSGRTTDPPPGPAKKMIQSDPIGAVSTVKENVIVSAGLLTPPSATQLFGGWIAEHFLVVQLTISNQSRDQQFILHDIFLDYSDWKLSGIYNGAPLSLEKSSQTRTFQDSQSATRRGQISSIGALEMQDSLKQNSVFSKRNFFVNGLVLIGSSAGGFTFLGPAGFTQGVAGYSSSFLPALQKFWPDRRIDQQSNVLKYGFQDKMVVAKEDPGKTYAFFPIERLLSNRLIEVYRDNPAYFLNVAELYLNPGSIGRGKRAGLKTRVDQMITLALSKDPELHCPSIRKPDDTGFQCVGTYELDARVLSDLFSPCYGGKNLDVAPELEPSCPILEKPEVPDPNKPTKLQEIRAVKDIVSGMSLNSIKVVVSGIMTVDVAQIPSVLTSIEFEDSGAGKIKLWENTDATHTGRIIGKYLLNGQPLISAIKVPDVPDAKPEQYFVTNPLNGDSEKATDSELPFSFKLKKVIPKGSTLSFRVVRTSNKSVNDPATANTEEKTTSMSLDYLVDYTPTPVKPAVQAPPADAAHPATPEPATEPA